MKECICKEPCKDCTSLEEENRRPKDSIDIMIEMLYKIEGILDVYSKDELYSAERAMSEIGRLFYDDPKS